MAVEYYIRDQPQYPHEREAVLAIAQSLQRAFAGPDHCYLLAANVGFWQQAQADALVLAPHAIVLLEFKSYSQPVHGHADNTWQTVPRGEKIYGGSYRNPYLQVSATREALMKFLDRNRKRFLDSARAHEMDGKWGHVSAAIVFSPYLHPDSSIVVPPASRPWLGVIGLNEVAEFLFTRVSSQIDLRPVELRRLASEVLNCRPWTEINDLIPVGGNYGHVWFLDESGKQAYAVPIADSFTIGRSRDNGVVVPSRYMRTSRHHARMGVIEGTVWLYDTASTYGTFVNGRPVSRDLGHPLHDGDRITLGDLGHPDACQLQFDSTTNPENSTHTSMTEA